MTDTPQAKCFTFEWSNPENNINEVIVTGDFDQWSKAIKLEPKKQKFSKTIKIPQDFKNNEIFFKFIVDGDWKNNSQYKIDGSHPSNNFILKSELETYDELRRTTSGSDTVYSDYTTISEPSIENQISPPVMVEPVSNSVDNTSITNSEVTLTSNPAATSSSPLSSSTNSRGSQNILSRFKNLFKQ